MDFKVTLKNQMTGATVEREVSCSYDATSVIEMEAKRQMKLPANWTTIKITLALILAVVLTASPATASAGLLARAEHYDTRQTISENKVSAKDVKETCWIVDARRVRCHVHVFATWLEGEPPIWAQWHDDVILHADDQLTIRPLPGITIGD